MKKQVIVDLAWGVGIVRRLTNGGNRQRYVGIQTLAKGGARVTVFPAELKGGAAEGADAVAIVTEWDAFRALDLTRVKELANAPVMVDLRNVYKPDDMRAAGFEYTSVGRG